MTVDLFAVRSVLFLPASNPRAIDKARGTAADLVVLDLEDAVKPEDKDAARMAAVESVAQDWPMPVAIRINGTASAWHGRDLAAITRCQADLVVLPRVEARQELTFVREQCGKPVAAMIETARGVLAAASITHDCAALIAGTNDLRADLRLPLDSTRDPISTALQLIVLAGRAAGIAVFDGVFNKLADPDGFAAECAEGRRLGFDGKSLIHPDQVEPCNRLFGPSEAEVARASKLVEAFSGGAERFEDSMIERMHVEAARRVLARAGISLEK
ncbi:MAG TPA: CoA ester lyase [Sphingomicrobium sp.]|nr:CoA ester lyase [Sphingomicrobium sp.]